eukprot:5720286-Prymnesium_polylepis.1
MTNEQKVASGVPDTAVRIAFVYPNPNLVLQTYARDAKFMPEFQTKVMVEATKGIYRDGGIRGIGGVRPDEQRPVQTKATR